VTAKTTAREKKGRSKVTLWMGSAFSALELVVSVLDNDPDWVDADQLARLSAKASEFIEKAQRPRGRARGHQ
jgi:hypothetical protein